MRRKLVAGNWKMNGSLAALAELDAIAAAAAANPGVDVAVAVPATLIAPATARVPALAIGAEDIHPADAGAHTGCVSAAMVVEAGASFTIVGHSERRVEQRESGQDVWAKAEAGRRGGLGVILCLGETDVERASGRAERVVASQLERALPAGAGADWLTIAYEPRWAIGTGLTPTADDVEAIHLTVRTKLVDLLGEPGGAIRILYGGSVTGENAAVMLAIPDVDGALVGGASLTAAKFVPIITAAATLQHDR
ncbi:triose-phosphate isomerase [Sphingomonas bacterium]|uniref:triose-phosphate isomerase n=1 Tax=Sphingomonas bacterium TaxID=1895847 RepID=UPI0015758AEE|nr:triose-phosphate isomerase [Sphingomonas bacterium]